MDRTERKVERLLEGIEYLMAAIDDLTTQVAATVGVEASAVAAIQGLAAAIMANAQDPAQINALADQLNTSAKALAAAISANPVPAPATPAPSL